MKEIKTIIKQLSYNEEFDKEVNKALREGWELVERKVLQPPSQPNTGSTYMHTMLYAELEKRDEEEGNPALDLIANLAKFVGAMAKNAEQPERVEPPTDVNQVCRTCKYETDIGEPCNSCTNKSHWEPKA